MKRSKVILLSALLLASNSAFSATTTVSPGNGLQAAIAAAADGDTILLESGVYTNADFVIEIGVSLTIKAASATMSPIIPASLAILNTVAINKLTIQGIQVGGIKTTSAEVNEVEIFESTLGSGQTEIRSSTFTMIASTRPCSDNNSLSITAGDIVLAGNTICNRTFHNTVSTTSSQGNKTITIIGNKFISQGGTRAGPLYIHGSAETLVASNLFIEQWAIPGSIYNGNGSSINYRFILAIQNERLTVKNNIFIAQTDRITAGITLRKISPVSDTTNLHFENNLVDAGNINIWSPAFGETEQDGMMQYGTTVPTSLKGNIFINYKDNILPLPTVDIDDANAQFNLCFNNTTNCGTTNGNLENDPLLIDSIDYKLAASSPAIDAGPTDVALSDLDGTRNNIGPYGGSWSIDQYDAQRAPDAVGPYIYPIVDAAKGVANGNVKVKFISYGRQL